MSDAPRLELDLISDPGCLPDVRQQMRAWVLALGWSEQQAEEVALAIDEAISNVIRHGYGGPCQERICVCARCIDDPDEGAGIEVQVRDFGRQVDPARICGRDLDDIRPGGLGVHIIKAVNNSVEYRRAEGGGMLLVMRKYKSHRVDPEQHTTERS